MLRENLTKKLSSKKRQKKSFKKRDLKFLSLGGVISILEGPTRTKEEKENINKCN